MVEILTHPIVTCALSIMTFINVCMMVKAQFVITIKDLLKGGTTLAFLLCIVCILSFFGTTVVRTILNVILAIIVIMSGGKS